MSGISFFFLKSYYIDCYGLSQIIYVYVRMYRLLYFCCLIVLKKILYPPPTANKVWGYIHVGVTLSVRPPVCTVVTGPYLSYVEALEVLTSHEDCL